MASQHQPVRRIYFTDIEPDWLRALARVPAAMPRYIDEFVMGQIENDQALERLPTRRPARSCAC